MASVDVCGNGNGEVEGGRRIDGRELKNFRYENRPSTGFRTNHQSDGKKFEKFIRNFRLEFAEFADFSNQSARASQSHLRVGFFESITICESMGGVGDPGENSWFVCTPVTRIPGNSKPHSVFALGSETVLHCHGLRRADGEGRPGRETIG